MKLMKQTSTCCSMTQQCLFKSHLQGGGGDDGDDDDDDDDDVAIPDRFSSVFMVGHQY